MGQSHPVRARLTRIGNSLGVRIPRVMLAQAGLATRMLQSGEVGPEVELSVEEGAIVIRACRDASASFEEQALVLLHQVRVAPADARQYALHALHSMIRIIKWEQAASTRLAAIVRNTFLNYGYQRGKPASGQLEGAYAQAADAQLVVSERLRAFLEQLGQHDEPMLVGSPLFQRAGADDRAGYLDSLDKLFWGDVTRYSGLELSLVERVIADHTWEVVETYIRESEKVKKVDE